MESKNIENLGILKDGSYKLVFSSYLMICNGSSEQKNARVSLVLNVLSNGLRL